MSSLTYIKKHIPTRKPRHPTIKRCLLMASIALSCMGCILAIAYLRCVYLQRTASNLLVDKKETYEVAAYFNEFMSLTSYEARENYLVNLCDKVQDVNEDELSGLLIPFVVEAKVSGFCKD